MKEVWRERFIKIFVRMDTQAMVMTAIALWVVFLAYPSRVFINDFYARKLCHSGCGLGMMMLDSKRLECRLFVWSVAGSSIAMTWNMSPLPPFRFARPKDVGITAYLILVSAWFFLQLPAPILAPLFFADPAGAVVRRTPSPNAEEPSPPHSTSHLIFPFCPCVAGRKGRNALRWPRSESDMV